MFAHVTSESFFPYGHSGVYAIVFNNDVFFKCFTHKKWKQMKIFTQDLEANIQICYVLDRGPPNQDANTQMDHGDLGGDLSKVVLLHGFREPTTSSLSCPRGPILLAYDFGHMDRWKRSSYPRLSVSS